MANHNSTPTGTLRGLNVKIGDAPDFGHKHQQPYIYAKEYAPQQIFTFAGPGPHGVLDPADNPGYRAINPDYDYKDYFDGDPGFAIIMHAPPKTDTSNPTRELGGHVIPYRHVHRQWRAV